MEDEGKLAIPSICSKDFKMHFEECNLVWFDYVMSCVLVVTLGVFHLKPSLIVS